MPRLSPGLGSADSSAARKRPGSSWRSASQGRRHGAQRIDGEQLRQDLPAEFGGADKLPDRGGAQIAAGEFGPKLGGCSKWSSLAHVHQHGGRGARRVGFALVAHGFERGQGRGSGFRMRHQPDHRFVAQVGVRAAAAGRRRPAPPRDSRSPAGPPRWCAPCSGRQPAPRAQMLLGVAATAHQQARRQRREPDPPPVPRRLRHHDRHYERTVVGREVPSASRWLAWWSRPRPRRRQRWTPVAAVLATFPDDGQPALLAAFETMVRGRCTAARSSGRARSGGAHEALLGRLLSAPASLRPALLPRVGESGRASRVGTAAVVTPGQPGRSDRAGVAGAARPGGGAGNRTAARAAVAAARSVRPAGRAAGAGRGCGGR